MLAKIRNLLTSLDAHDIAVLAVAWGAKVVVAVLIFLIGWWIARRISSGAQRILLRGGADPLLGDFLRNIVFAFLLALVVVGALDRIGVPTASLLAALGAAGLAVGLALQGSLSNLAAGVLIMLTRPFRVGDFIEVAGVSGTVRSMSLMHTVLYSPDNCQVIVPNGKILGDSITNYSTLDKRRLDLTVGIGYQDDVDKAIGLVNSILENDDRVLEDPPPLVAVLELAESSVNLAIRPWVAPQQYWPLKFDLQRQIKLEFDANGITIPFPQSEITLKR